jgi:alpha-mannosidase
MADSRKNGCATDKQGTVFIIAHHHSDIIWKRTKTGYDRVRARQLSALLGLFDRFPDFRFVYAQSNILQTFLRDCPEDAGHLRSLIADGRIELVGGGVCIPDTNLPCGEALLRNFLLGKRYYREEFGREIDTAWLMDAFGMNAQIPQILTKLGFKYLFPGRMPGLPAEIRGQKGFVWQGLDGSAIIVHPEEACVQQGTHLCNLPLTYSIEERLRDSLEEMANLPGQVFGLYSTEEEVMREDVAALLPEISRRTGREYRFGAISEINSALDTGNLPRIRGEFNPEFTGCYTTRIRIKQLNRRAESALRTAETLASLAGMIAGEEYPRTRLRRLWEQLFICQFHDGICGCHVEAVQDEVLDAYYEIICDASALAAGSLRGIAPGNVGAGTVARTLIFNPLPTERNEVVFLDAAEGLPVDYRGITLPSQRDGERIAVLARVPSLGAASIAFVPGDSGEPALVSGNYHPYFATKHYSITFTEGAIRIADRDTPSSLDARLPFGEILYREDRGDLWTENFCGIQYSPAAGEERLERVVRGPLFSRVFLVGEIAPRKEASWDGFGGLAWEKQFTFYEHERRFDLRLTLRFTGRNTQVALAFPLAIDPHTAKAAYSIPFGSIERRPYYEVSNTFVKTASVATPGILERAKGDWPALYWADYSDERSGLTIANRGTPGHQLKNGRIQVSILRSPTRMASAFAPEPGAWDNGRRIYEFAFLPHTGGASPACVQFGEAFNHPLFVGTSGSSGNTTVPPPDHPCLAIDNPSVVMTALKQAEDGDGWILRLHEACGQECAATLSVNIPVQSIQLVDVDEKGSPMPHHGSLLFEPFEIKTLRIRCGNGAVEKKI